MSFLNELETIQHPDIKISKNIDLTLHSTMRLVSRGDLIEVLSVEGLIFFQKLAAKHSQTFRVLGWGANQPLPEVSSIPYLKLNFPFDRAYLEDVRKEYILPASVSLANLTKAASTLCLGGWEGFTGVPASLGGAIVMNAGTGLGEIGNVVKEVFIVDKAGEKRAHQVTKDSFVYRNQNFLNEGDVIYAATLIVKGVDQEMPQKIKEYLAYRNKTQPMKAWTCGCMFKNHTGANACRAGESIDILGMKGMRYKNLRISPIHANFLENLGGANLEEVKEFTTLISDKLFEKFGVRFELELKI